MAANPRYKKKPKKKGKNFIVGGCIVLTAVLLALFVFNYYDNAKNNCSNSAIREITANMFKKPQKITNSTNRSYMPLSVRKAALMQTHSRMRVLAELCRLCRVRLNGCNR